MCKHTRKISIRVNGQKMRDFCPSFTQLTVCSTTQIYFDGVFFRRDCGGHPRPHVHRVDSLQETGQDGVRNYLARAWNCMDCNQLVILSMVAGMTTGLRTRSRNWCRLPRNKRTPRCKSHHQSRVSSINLLPRIFAFHETKAQNYEKFIH